MQKLNLKYSENKADELKEKGFKRDTKVSGFINYEIWRKEDVECKIDHAKKTVSLSKNTSSISYFDQTKKFIKGKSKTLIENLHEIKADHKTADQIFRENEKIKLNISICQNEILALEAKMRNTKNLIEYYQKRKWQNKLLIEKKQGIR